MSVRALGLLLLLTVLTNVWFLGRDHQGFPLDDAWVHMVYARSVAELQGFAFNGDTLEAGVTAPLWTSLAAVPEKLSRMLQSAPRPDVGMRWMGALFGMLTAWAGYRLSSRAGRWPAVFAALLLTLDPLMIFSRFSGMELPLFSLLSILLAEAVLDERATRAGWLCGALVLTRPEGLVLTVLALAFLIWRRRGLVGFLVPVVLCVVPWLVYCQMVSGRPFPNTVATKAGLVLDPFVLWPVVESLVVDTGWSWSLPVLLVAGGISLNGGYRLLGTVLLAGGLAMIAAVLLTRPMALDLASDPPLIPFYWERHAMLAWPMLLIVLGAGIGSLVRTAYAGMYCRPLAAALLIGPLITVLFLARSLPGQTAELRERFRESCANVEALNVAAGRWVRDNVAVGALVATHDVGAVRYFGERDVLDIWGNHNSALTTAMLAGDFALARRLQIDADPDAFVCLPLLYAPNLAEPEYQHLAETYADRPARLAAVLATLNEHAEPVATSLGLTKRVKTFHLDSVSTIDSPLHQDLAVFVRP